MGQILSQVVSMTRAKPKQIGADVKWENGVWVAHPNSPTGERYVNEDGEKIIGQGRSPTKALSRLAAELESAGFSVTVEPKWHVPTPYLARYNKFSKELAQWLMLTKTVVPERAELAQIFVKEYDMPLAVVGELVGLSPPRVGVLLDNMATGKPVMGKRGRPKRDADED